MKKNILIVSTGPFGSLTDAYEYAVNLSDKFNVTYLGFDGPKTIDKLQDISIIHLPPTKGWLATRIRLYEAIKELERAHHFFSIIYIYFLGSMFFRGIVANSILDIRSTIIHKSIFLRKALNIVLSLEANTFSKVTIIDKGILNLLSIRKSICHELPLTANMRWCKLDHSQTLTFLYVGTLHLRRIDDTINAYKQMLIEKSNLGINRKTRYVIVGSGHTDDQDRLRSLIDKLSLGDEVHFLGEIRGENLNGIYIESSIGISYVPITKYFNFQPPTKTFEYFSWGLPVLATKSAAHAAIINTENGILHQDNIESLASAMLNIICTYDQYDPVKIVNQLDSRSWNKIIESHLIPVILQ